MKRIVLSLLISLPVISVAQAKIKFTDPKQNFGFVKKGEKVILNYQFTNEGNQPLIVSEGKAECSCTSVSWTKEPVAPGQTGTVTVVFDT
ncbi:MAG: DUF1573 domain-containing protein, partial [Bacteroidia bacterium]